LLGTMYDLPSLEGVSKVVVSETTINEHQEPLIVYQTESAEKIPENTEKVTELSVVEDALTSKSLKAS